MIRPLRSRGLAAAMLCLLAAGPAGADGFERVPALIHAATRTECGECHMAFQRELLPAASWNRIMDGLADHFDEDARLPEAVAADIRAYLAGARSAGRRERHAERHPERRPDPSILRITEQPWWLREHRRIAAETWRRPDIRSRVNCVACHPRAERGDYDDD